MVFISKGPANGGICGCAIWSCDVKPSWGALCCCGGSGWDGEDGRIPELATAGWECALVDETRKGPAWKSVCGNSVGVPC